MLGANRRFGAWAWMACALLLGAACGGDDDSGDTPSAGTGGSFGTSGSGGSAGSAGSSAGSGGTSTGMAGSSGMGGAGSGGSAGSAGASGAGAGGSSGSGGTAGTMADPCEGLANPCDEASAACDGDTLVTCAENADGCLVETTRDCTQGNTDFCDENADPPACAEDPCAGLDLCETAGVTCDSNELVTCAENGDGCLVETRTDCTQGSTEICDPDLNPPACANDPCEGVPNRCTTAGTTCNGTDLVTCAEDSATGCLVADSLDCLDQTGCTGGDCNFCDAAAATPACDRDPCRNADGSEKENVCVVDETTCAETILITCVEDTAGCPIATPTDCTQETGCTGGACNACDPDADPDPECIHDPCVGVTDCPAESEVCDGTNIVTCAPNNPVDNCLVETVTDCTVGGTVTETCAIMNGEPQCVSCQNDAGCTVAGTSCASNVFRVCEDTDDNGCLNLTTEDCGADFVCDAQDGCVFDNDPCELEDELRAPGSYGPYTTTGQGNDYANYMCTGLNVTIMAAAHELLFAVDVPPGATAEISLSGVTGFSGTGAWLLLLTTCANANSESDCEDLSSTSVRWTNETTETVRVYITVEGDTAGSSGSFGLEVDTRMQECGDGSLDGSEQCDDGGVLDNDGCSTTCMLETGYQCTGGSPSICTTRPSNNICGNVMCDPIQGAPPMTDICCTPQQTCGVAYEPAYGAGCIERDQGESVNDASCPDESSSFPLLYPTLNGCCRDDDRCGLTAAVGAGCVERTEVWLNMEDGLGEFLYDGPFEEVDCNFP